MKFLNKRGELDKVLTSVPVLLGVFVFTILFVGGSYFVSLKTNWDAIPASAGISSGLGEVMFIPVSLDAGKVLPLADVLTLSLKDGEARNHLVFKALSKKSIEQEEDICLLIGGVGFLGGGISGTIASPRNFLFFRSKVMKELSADSYGEVEFNCGKVLNGFEPLFEQYKKRGALGMIELTEKNKEGKEVKAVVTGYFGRCLNINVDKGCPLSGDSEVVK